jgi:hypothetical protein
MTNTSGKYVCQRCGFVNENVNTTKITEFTDYKARKSENEALELTYYKKFWICNECGKRNHAGKTSETQVKDIDDVPHHGKCSYCGELFYGTEASWKKTRHIRENCEQAPFGEMSQLLDMRRWKGNEIEDVTNKSVDLNFSDYVYRLELEHGGNKIAVLISFNEEDDWPESVYVKEQVRLRDKLLRREESLLMTKEDYQNMEYGHDIDFMDQLLIMVANKAHNKQLETIDEVINAEVGF